jgi:hypothetical protein
VRASRLIHVAGALVVAALAPALAGGALALSLSLIAIVFLVALGHAVLLGIPLLALLWSRRLVNWLAAMVSGFVIGAVPIALVSWPLHYGERNTNAWSDHIQTIANGVPTAAGWIQYLQGVVAFGAFGALGGVGCWLWLRTWRALPSTVTELGAVQEPRSSAVASSIVVALVAGVLAIPVATRDRSCHNVLRDGRKSIGPQVSIDLKISDTDWALLKEVFETFAARNHLSFRDDSEVRPDILRTLYLSVCNDGVTIDTAEQRWASQGYEAPSKGRGVGIGVSGSECMRHIRDLVGNGWRGNSSIVSKSGGRVRFDSAEEGVNSYQHRRISHRGRSLMSPPPNQALERTRGATPVRSRECRCCG